MQKENDKINEEKNKREQRKQEEIMLQLKKIKAATKIQALIRGYLARKALKKVSYWTLTFSFFPIAKGQGQERKRQEMRNTMLNC